MRPDRDEFRRRNDDPTAGMPKPGSPGRDDPPADPKTAGMPKPGSPGRDDPPADPKTAGMPKPGAPGSAEDARDGGPPAAAAWK